MDSEGNYYRERNVPNKLPIILIIVMAILLLVLIVVFVIKGLNKKSAFDIESDLLTTSKNYYSSNSASIPLLAGECSTVTLENLLSSNMITEHDEYDKCNKYNTKVKVCKLESGKYQYTPILECSDINTEQEFSEWSTGTESNLITDKSDVQLSFLGYKKIEVKEDDAIEKWEDEITVKKYTTITKTAYYRYRDKEWLWQEIKPEYFTNKDVGSVLAYYATSPDSNYNDSDSETTAYKWYIEQNVPKATIKIYACKSSTGSAVSYKKAPCSESIDGKTETVKEFYSCGTMLEDASGKLYYPEQAQDTKCDCSSNEYGTDCSVKKTYYPSNYETASRESTYYAIAPVTGAIKDINTKETVSRYYKMTTTVTTKYYSTSPSSTATKVGDGRWGNWTEYKTAKPKEYNTREIEIRNKIKYQISESDSEWEKISENYLSLDEFIGQLQSLEYDVKSLKDINNNDKLKYEIQLKYRNRNK